MILDFFQKTSVLDVKAYFVVLILLMGSTILTFPIVFFSVLDKRGALWDFNMRLLLEASVCRCSIIWMFLKMSQSSRENF